MGLGDSFGNIIERFLTREREGEWAKLLRAMFATLGPMGHVCYARAYGPCLPSVLGPMGHVCHAWVDECPSKVMGQHERIRFRDRPTHKQAQDAKLFYDL